MGEDYNRVPFPYCVNHDETHTDCVVARVERACAETDEALRVILREQAGKPHRIPLEVAPADRTQEEE